MKDNKFDVVFYTHKASDTRFSTLDASYFDVVKHSIKDEAFSDRVIVAITMWNFQKERQEKKNKAEFLTTKLIESMNKKLGFEEKSKLKNVMFFTDSPAEVQAEITYLINMFEKTEL
jgi:hypothetical protein